MSVSDDSSGADWPWLCALWAAAALFFWPVLLGGSSFYFRDTLTYYYPEALTTARAWGAGVLPLWKASIGAGFPFLADPHSAVFYPLTLLLALLPMPRGYDVFTAVHVPLAGTGLYLLLRRWRLGRPASALGAAVLMFSGFTIGATCLTIVLRGVAWMPLALVAFDFYLERGGIRWLAAAALVLAVQGSGTDPLYVALTLVLAAALPLLRPVENSPANWRRALTAPLLAGGWAMALLAIQIAPLAELLAASDKTAGLAESELLHFSLRPAQLVNAVLPLSYPDPASPAYLTSFPGGEVPFYPDLYWGVPALALAAAAFGWRKKREAADRERKGERREDESSASVDGQPEPARAVGSRADGPSFKTGLGQGSIPTLERSGISRAADQPAFARATLAWAALAVAALAVSQGAALPFFSLLTSLVWPLRFIRYPAKYFVSVALAVPVLAAFGFEGLCRERKECVTAILRVLSAATAGLFLALVAVKSSGPAVARAFLSGGKLTLGGETGPLLAEVSAHWSRNLLSAGLLSALLATLVWLMARGKLPSRTVLAALGLWAAGDLAFTTIRSYPVMSDWVLTDPPRSASFIAPAKPGEPPPRFVGQSPGNVLALDDERTVQRLFLLERELMTHFIGIVHGLDPIPRSSAVWIDAMRRLALLLEQASPRERLRLAAAAGARYSLELEDSAVSGLPGRVLGKSGPVLVRELPDPLPRAFVAGRAMAAPATLPSSSALLSMPDVAWYLPAEGVDGVLTPSRIGPCKLTAYSDRELTVDFDLDGRGLLVVADQFYPGWSALVDGKPRTIVKVAGLFRGVPVTQGERRLVMRYAPSSFGAGGGVSLIALLVTLGLFMGRLRSTPDGSKRSGKRDRTR